MLTLQSWMHEEDTEQPLLKEGRLFCLTTPPKGRDAVLLLPEAKRGGERGLVLPSEERVVRQGRVVSIRLKIMEEGRFSPQKRVGGFCHARGIQTGK